MSQLKTIINPISNGTAISEQQYYNFIQKLIKDTKTPGHKMVAGDLNLMKRLEILQVQKNGTIVENLGVGTS